MFLLIRYPISLFRNKICFNQEPFRTKLINTLDENIVEGNWWGDVFWGVNLKVDPNVGENHLGRLIMEIRKELV